MVLGMITALAIWIIAAPLLFLLSAFVHELSHFLTAKLTGLEVVRYRLVSVPGNRGYVDVRLNSQDPLIFIKRIFLHGAGPLSHLAQGVLFAWLLRSGAGLTLSGVFVTGLLVNLYLLLLNLLAEESDGLLVYRLFKAR